MNIKIDLKKFTLCSIPGIIFCLYFIYSGSFETPYGRQFTLSDTSMVSMTYAKTLINTGELVWYEGAERVQGFSNFLYTILFAFIHLFKFSYSLNSLFVSIINIAVLLLISYKVVVLCNILNSKNIESSYFLGALVFFQYPLVFWSLRGYEVGVLALITISTIERIFKVIDRNKSKDSYDLFVLWLYLSIGVWITLDYVIAALTISFYITVILRNYFESYKLLICFNLGIIFSIFLLLFFQYVYFEDLLPNTFYLKTGGFYLIEKIPRGIISSFKILPILLIQFYLLVKNYLEKSYSKKLNLILIFTASLTIYNIFVGGDNWEVYGFANRILTLVIPLGLIAVSYTDEKRFFNPNKLLNIVFSTLLIFGVFFLQFNLSNLNIKNFYCTSFEIIYITVSCLILLLFVFNNHFNYLFALLITIFVSFTHINYLVNTELQISSTEFLNTQIGIELKNFTTKDATIGVLWAGNIAYYSERRMVDFLGKSDKYIAKSEPVRLQNNNNKYNFTDFDPGHNKWNFKYSIGILTPDVILRTWDDYEFYEQIKKNGYEKICVVFKYPFDSEKLEIYIKKGSSKILKENIFFCNQLKN